MGIFLNTQPLHNRFGRMAIHLLVLVLVLGVAFLAVTELLWAAPIPEKIYSFRQIIKLALENNRSIQAAQYKLDASNWNVKKAYSEFLPKVLLSQRFTRNDDISVRNANFAIEGIKSFPGFEDVDIPPLLFKNTHSTGFTISIPIYNGGRLSSSLEMSKLTKETDRLGVIDTESEVKHQVSIAFFNYVKSRELIQVREKVLLLAQANLDNARAKNELGLRPKSDILRWEAQVASEESGLIEAQNTAEITQIILANLAGLDVLETFDVSGFPENEFIALRMRYAEYADPGRPDFINRFYNQALLNNPGRQIAEMQSVVSQSAEKIARSAFLPDINFSYSYAWQDNDTPELDGFKSWDATIQVSYALFNGLHDVADLQRARAETRQLEKLEEDFERSIFVSLYTALNTIKSSLARINLSEKNLIHANDNLEIIQSRYNLGLSSNIDLIDAQVLESTAQVDLINARFDLLIAGADLERTIGKSLDESLLQE